MARISLDTLNPGMRLEKPVCNLHGVLLLKAGEALTAKHLEMFKAWGIREADVVGANGEQPEAAPQPELPAEVLAQARAITAQRFRRAEPPGDPVLAEILRVATRRLARRLLAQGRV